MKDKTAPPIASGLGWGVAQDVIQACAWLSLASKTIELAQRGCDALAQRMSSEQLALGRKRTTELSAEIEAKPTGSVAR